MIIFLSISLNVCFGCSKDLFHRAGSFEYPQHMFWLRNKNNNFLLRTFILGPINIEFNPLYTGTFTNSEDPDEMPHDAAFHQGLHCL